MEPDIHQRCGLDYEMSTSGRGVIIPAERGNEIGPQDELRALDNRGDRFSEPSDWCEGVTGDIAGNSTEGRA